MSDNRLELLIVDDGAVPTEAIVTAFPAAGVDLSVRRVATLAGLGEAAAAGCPDLVLADLVLPDGTLADSLAAAGDQARWPVVAMARPGEELAALAAVKAGALEAVVKADQAWADLPRTVERALREWRVRQDQARTALELKAVFECTHDAIGVSKAGTHCFVNPAYVALFGYDSAAELIGRPILDLIAPASRATVLENVRRRNAGEPVPATYRLEARRKDGSTFDMDVAASTYALGGERYTLVILRDVSAEQRARTALHESEERYRRLVEMAPDAIFVHVESRFVFANAAGARLLGAAAPEELYGRPIIESVHPSHRQLVQERVRRIRESGQAAALNEELFVRLDGQCVQVEVAAIPFVHEGRPAVQVVARDVTDRKRAEEALAHSEHLYRTLVEAADDGIVLTDLEGRHLFTNSAYFRSLGFDRSDSPHPTSLDRVHPDDLDRVKALMVRLRSEGTLCGEYRVRHRDGSWVYHFTKSTVIRDIAGEPWAVLSIIRDTTERHHAEAALRQANQQLSSIFRTLPDLYFRMRSDGTILDYKAGRSGDLYVPPEVFMGKRMQQVLPPDVALLVENGIGRALDGELATIEYTLPMPTGEQAIEARIIATEDREIITVIRDITEHRRAEEQRLELERRLLHAQKLESLGVLAGGIAHDFNNLLMAILGNLDLAAHSLSPGMPARNNVEAAIQATRRATDLTRQMLAYSGKGRFVSTRLDLNELVQENASLLRTAIPRTVTLTLDLAQEPTPMEGDPGQVQQVVMNLITNAAEAIGEGPGVVTLATGLAEYGADTLASSRLEERPEPGRFAFVEVRDTGCGMDEVTQARLFDPFFSTKFTGRGLGMSAVLGIVRGHRGAVLVDSAPNRGTVVRVLFPAAPIEAGVTELSEASAEQAEGAHRGAILVVDDDEVIRDLCQRYLHHLGHASLCAADGEEALALADALGDKLACVVLDLTMPGMDGVAVFEELQRRQPGLPVLLASGFAEEDVMQRFAGPGPAGFLQKPFRLQELKTKLALVLEGSQPDSHG